MARHSADDFIASVIKASVARLAVLQGTRRAESMALGVISDVVQRYIETIGVASKDIAEAGGRSEINEHDVLEALQEMPHMLGPRSAKELLDAHDAYVNDVQTNGSAPTLDLTGAVTDTSAGGVAYPRSLQQGAPRPAHIPSYMPPLPEPHTYSHTKMKAVKRKTNKNANRKRQLTESRHVQDSLAVIHAAGGAGRVPKSRRLMNSTGAGQTSGGSGSGSGSGGGGGSGSGSGGGGGSGSGDADTPMNPYLALAHKYVPTPSHLAQKQSHSKSTGGPAVLNRTGDADIQPLSSGPRPT